MNKKQKIYLALIAAMVIGISLLHYTTPTMKWQFHLVYMQAYFIPIILAAFQFGIKGGLGTALAVSILYFPHIMFQWGGLIENNLLRFLQIGLFNILGYLTGLKAQGERTEKERFQKAAENLRMSLENQQLQSEKISEMEQQLRAADRLAIIGEMTASLAHEVRNPLGAIRGAVEIIRDTVPDNLKKLEFFDILLQDTERLNRVVENYLQLARKNPGAVSRFDLRDSLKNIAGMMGPQLRKQNIRLQLNLANEPLQIECDPSAIWQIVLNVLLNAIQAMPDGGEINIAAQLTESDNPENQKTKTNIIALSVSDEGTGIPEKDLKNIFKPFFTTRKDGTGLGLAIVKRIADEHGWQLQVKSVEQSGTTFEIFIPAANDDKIH